MHAAAGPIDVPTLAALLADDADVRLLDVRTPGEFETAHIPGSYNLPLDLLGEHRAELRRMEQDVVLVCQSGGRAGQAEAKLAEAGMTNVHVLAGGMNAWTLAGQAVNRGAERWSLERQVRLVAGGLVLASVLASVAAPKAKWLAGGIGAGLAFAALTDTCAMGSLLARLPYNQRGESCDAEAIVEQLVAMPAAA